MTPRLRYFQSKPFTREVSLNAAVINLYIFQLGRQDYNLYGLSVKYCGACKLIDLHKLRLLYLLNVRCIYKDIPSKKDVLHGCKN